jgi:hypothetical protein
MFLGWSSTKLLFCHLGFPIGIKNSNLVKEIPMIIHLQFGFSQFISFQNASSLKPLGQLKPNCPGMIIGRSSTKFLFVYADPKSKMAATAGHRLTLDPMGKCSNAFFSETANTKGSNVKLSPAVAAILNFISEHKT